MRKRQEEVRSAGRMLQCLEGITPPYVGHSMPNSGFGLSEMKEPWFYLQGADFPVGWWR